jgi:hypothetical protein
VPSSRSSSPRPWRPPESKPTHLGTSDYQPPKVSTAIGDLMGPSGLAYLVQGRVVDSEGFSGIHTTLVA